MVHGRQQLFRWDGNNDGYLDAPLSNHIFVQNAWKHNGKNSEAQFGIKASTIKNIGGSTLYGYPTLVPIWSHELKTNRYELWAKRGYFLDGGINRSIGTQFSATYQDLDSYFGNRLFTGKERRLYGNLILQDNIFNTRHTLKGGLDANSFSISQQMWENDGSYDGLCTGVYGEYSYVNSPDGEGFSMILGQRIDVLRHYLPFYVPRLHLKYNSGPWAFRGQASRSWRIPTLGAEYMGYMANNRTAVFLGNGGGPIIETIEKSNTYGIGVNWSKDVLFKEMQWYADVFYTQFANKVVFDFDGSTDTLLIGSPGGAYPNIQERILYSPYSISAQVGGQYELFHRTMIKVSYRYQDVKQRDLTVFYASGAIEDYFRLEEVILNVPHLIYGGLSYSGRRGLGFELNATYNSSQRLPTIGYAKRSPAFTMLNAQFSKKGRAYGQIYVGFQNLLNVRQLNPIVGGDLPFDGNFDASIVWGPIMGRQVYAGWRYDLRFQE